MEEYENSVELNIIPKPDNILRVSCICSFKGVR